MNVMEICQEFFNKYADAVKVADVETLKSLYQLPFIVVHDETKSVMNHSEQLTQAISDVLMSLQMQEIITIYAKPRAVLNVSGNLHFATIDWQFEKATGESFLNYPTSYILKVNETGVSIVTIVIDDEADLYLELLAKINPLSS